MSFRDQPFSHRIGKMGDEAEGVFEAVCTQGFERYGLNRPRVNLATVAARVRYTPDYLTSDRLVEVQGVGSDQTIKIKRDKLDCLCYWNTIMPLDFFVWDSRYKRYAQFPLTYLTAAIDGGKVELGFFPEGKAYFAMSTKHVEGWKRYKPEPTTTAA